MENARDDIPGLDTSSEYEDAQSHTSHGEPEYLTPQRVKSRTSSLLQLMGSVKGLESLKGEEEEETDFSEIDSDQSSITADIPEEQQPEILRKNTPGRAPTLPDILRERHFVNSPVIIPSGGNQRRPPSIQKSFSMFERSTESDSRIRQQGLNGITREMSDYLEEVVNSNDVANDSDKELDIIFMKANSPGKQKGKKRENFFVVTGNLSDVINQVEGFTVGLMRRLGRDTTSEDIADHCATALKYLITVGIYILCYSVVYMMIYYPIECLNQYSHYRVWTIVRRVKSSYSFFMPEISAIILTYILCPFWFQYLLKIYASMSSSDNDPQLEDDKKKD